MIIDLAQYFAVLSGSPPAGHPILNPHQSLGQLNDWQRCQITASVVDAQSTLGIVFSHLVIKDIAGAHFFDLTMSPFNCPTATIPCVVVATSPLGPGSIQLDHTPCPAAAGASYVMAVTPNAGAFPVGWFFGIDIAWSLLLTEFLAGYPFTGTLDSIGATLIGPYGGIAPGTCYSVTVHFTPGYGDLISSRPAINVTVP